MSSIEGGFGRAQNCGAANQKASFRSHDNPTRRQHFDDGCHFFYFVFRPPFCFFGRHFVFSAAILFFLNKLILISKSIFKKISNFFFFFFRVDRLGRHVTVISQIGVETSVGQRGPDIHTHTDTHPYSYFLFCGRYMGILCHFFV